MNFLVWDFVMRISQQGEEAHNRAFLTLETLSSTSNGSMSPITTTLLLSRSTVYDVTPSNLETCFSTFLAQPWQCIETRSTTILGFNWKARVWLPPTTSFNLSSWDFLWSESLINGFFSSNSSLSRVFMQKQEHPVETLKQSNTLPKLSFPIPYI